MLSRPVGGLACKVRLSTRQYKAVAVIARGESHTICLLHGERGLSVELTEFDDAEAAEDYCHRLAAFLDLPTLLMAGGDADAAHGGR